MYCEAFILCWNEEETIALTLLHYKKFCDRITVLDNFSTDRSRDIAIEHGCNVKLFGVSGVLDDREYTKIKNSIWKDSKADWVFIVDADEIIVPNNDKEFAWMDVKYTLSMNKGFGILKAKGWQVVSHQMPKENWLEITTGYEYDQYSKMVCINPKAIKEINYTHGCHIANPKAREALVIVNNAFTLLHYRNVGGPERLVKRHALYRERMSDWNIRWKAGGHYLYEDSQRRKEWQEQYEKSVPYSQAGF